MLPAVIFANGEMKPPSQFLMLVKSSPLIISADGGIHNCISLEITPHVIIGDLDSMPTDQLVTFREQGTEVIQYPTHKDETDLELALNYTSEKHYEEVIILGALGARWDMTIANVLLLAHAAHRMINVRLLDGDQELVLLRPGSRSHIKGTQGDTLSLIPLAGDAIGITTSGLEYPLYDETLTFGATRGISNVISSNHAEVIFHHGLILCVITRTKHMSNDEQD